MKAGFLQKFKRVTDNHSYLPEIDGLRFLAVFLVVVIMHITHYIDDKFFNNHMIRSPYWKDFVMEGNNGVALFFVISGFILSIPFARWHLENGRKVDIRHYYLRRLIRIEPPYLIVLLLAFMAHAFLLHIYSLSQLFPSFAASVFYLHTLIYQDFPYVLPVAWSLEIEVQFYILAPLFCFVFLIMKERIRRFLLLLVIIGNVLLVFNGSNILGVVFVFLHFFASGLLLADLYVSHTVVFKNEKLGLWVGLVALFSLLFIGSVQNLTGYIIKLASIFFLVHTVLTNPFLNRLFSIPLLTIIGGMCYSIYLVHFAVISALGKVLSKYSVVSSREVLFLPYLFLFVTTVVFVSGIFFLMVERPFMKLGVLNYKKPNGKPNTVRYNR